MTPNGNIVWHNGGTTSFGAYVGLQRDKRIGVVVLETLADMIDLGIAEQSVENPLARRVGKADIGLVGEHPWWGVSTEDMVALRAVL